MIITERINKNFGQHHVLKDVSFEIQKGEIVGFLGENGAGKTTLMRILTSYLMPTSGRVEIAHLDVAKHSMKVRRKIGYLPETPPLYLNMQVYDYLKFAAQLKDVSLTKRSFQIDRVLEECNLVNVKDKVIGTLSKGYRQRVGIAQAIINEPEVLILDEPTSGLDPVQIRQVRELIKAMEGKCTVILSTHVLSEIEQLVKKVMIIKNGQILANDTLTTLLGEKSSQKNVLLRIKGNRDQVEKAIQETNSLQQISIDYGDNIHAVELEISNELDHYHEITNMILKTDIKIVEIKELKSNLEDVFLRLNE